MLVMQSTNKLKIFLVYLNCMPRNKKINPGGNKSPCPSITQHKYQTFQSIGTDPWG